MVHFDVLPNLNMEIFLGKLLNQRVFPIYILHVCWLNPQKNHQIWNPFFDLMKPHETMSFKLDLG
jgi:hypothetical protein